MSAPLPLRLSASAVRDYRTCAYRYVCNYLSPLPPRERRPVTQLAFGDVVHQVIADFFRRGGWERLSRTEMLMLLDERWQAPIYADADQEEANRERAWEMLINFYETRYPRKVARELGVERRHSWAHFHRGILANGRIDRACLLEDGTLEMLDYKTGRRHLDREGLLAEPQALFYRSLGGEAYRRLAPRRIVVTFFYIATGIPVTAEFEHEDFLAGWQRIEQVAMAIRRSVAAIVAGTPMVVAFPPSRGDHCRMCPMRGHCDRLAAAGRIAGVDPAHGGVA